MRCKRHSFDPCVGKIPFSRNGNLLQYSCLEKSHGQRSLVGYSPWGCKELHTTERLTLSLSLFFCILSMHQYFITTLRLSPSVIPSCGWYTLYLPIYLLMDIWIVSSFGYLGKCHYTLASKLLCWRVFWCLLSGCPGVELLVVWLGLWGPADQAPCIGGDFLRFCVSSPGSHSGYFLWIQLSLQP